MPWEESSTHSCHLPHGRSILVKIFPSTFFPLRLAFNFRVFNYEDVRMCCFVSSHLIFKYKESFAQLLITP